MTTDDMNKSDRSYFNQWKQTQSTHTLFILLMKLPFGTDTQQLDKNNAAILVLPSDELLNSSLFSWRPELGVASEWEAILPIGSHDGKLGLLTNDCNVKLC